MDTQIGYCDKARAVEKALVVIKLLKYIDFDAQVRAGRLCAPPIDP